MSASLVAKGIAAVAIGVYLQVWAVLFAFWYGDVLDMVFCNSSFFGRAECPDPRPLRDFVVWGVPIVALLFGGTVPARLFGARWQHVIVVFIVAPLITLVLLSLPIVLLIALG